MHQQGFDTRATTAALRAFDRRGWLVRGGGTVEISEEGFNTKPEIAKPAPISKRKHTRLPRGLFGG